MTLVAWVCSAPIRRERWRSRPIPAIVVTGYPDRSIEADARKMCAEFLLKPISPASLLALVQQKLEAIVRFGAIPRLETQSTVIEEGEVNAYLEHYLRAEIPPGISTPVTRPCTSIGNPLVMPALCTPGSARTPPSTRS